jgi:predicted amidohydrolase
MLGKKAVAVLIPAAFNMLTGPAHWEVLLRARAIDNQVYIAAASPARNVSSSYIAYGNSLVADPWGSVISKASAGEEIIYAELKYGELERIREELPLLKHRRKDLYNVTHSSK